MLRKLSLVLVVCLLGAFTFDSPAEAKKKRKRTSNGLLSFLKLDPTAASGACLNKVSSEKEAKLILARNKVKIAPTANADQLKTLATAVYQIERLSGGVNPYVAGVHLRFPKVKGYSKYHVSTPYIDMGANFNDKNVAHITHEMGHYAGHAGLYPLYYKRVPPCKFTNYTLSYYHPSAKRNEEFAEVWAAFITRPEFLKNSKIPGCQRAYDFFLEIFPRGKELAHCEAKNQR